MSKGGPRREVGETGVSLKRGIGGKTHDKTRQLEIAFLGSRHEGQKYSEKKSKHRKTGGKNLLSIKGNR